MPNLHSGADELQLKPGEAAQRLAGHQKRGYEGEELPRRLPIVHRAPAGVAHGGSNRQPGGRLHERVHARLHRDDLLLKRWTASMHSDMCRRIGSSSWNDLMTRITVSHRRVDLGRQWVSLIAALVTCG